MLWLYRVFTVHMSLLLAERMTVINRYVTVC